MTNISDTKNESIEKVLFSLPEEQFNAILKDITVIIENYSVKYDNEPIEDFLEKDYIKLLKKHLNKIKRVNGEFNYEVLNKSETIRDLKEKMEEKKSIRKLMSAVAEKYNSPIR